MEQKHPDYIFETSWEVCNKVGGIYTVLSTRAQTLTKEIGDNLIFFGPDIENIYPKAKATDFLPANEEQDWIKQLHKDTGIKARIGRWDIVGKPQAILIDFTPYYNTKNEIFRTMWERYQVNSAAAYGDYDEGCMFSYAVGKCMQHFYHFHQLENQKVVAHFNEWTTGFGLLYLNMSEPKIGTLFTTHATSIGRSIAGNNKPLYDQMLNYNGDQMADELNMTSKHSIEKTAAHVADCFTTVSDITNVECRQLLEKPADIVTPNGFEDNFVARGNAFTRITKKSRETLFNVAEHIIGYKLPEDTLFLGTSGRYEYKNKGLDQFIDALNILNNTSIDQTIVAYMMVPGWIESPCIELRSILDTDNLGIEHEYSTHRLVEPWNDPIIKALKWFHITNKKSDRVKVILVPSYLNGNDGIFNIPYYDLLPGFDMTAFPSYYEPWGYTPLESAAFGVPTITSNLSGFGQWVNPTPQSLESGVGIFVRTDANYHLATTQLASLIKQYARLPRTSRTAAKKRVRSIARKARWTEFIKYYHQAYHIALSKVETRS